ncbi:hypothetical protein PIB30_094953 [Stylosanthes scabra]|uniref:Uncharacterized protein n=1 Tax=Stylosanthes scabra TaxID=79078 RepID=A0ABU6RVW6_9FABA|nr:hypothetical protein [Stylosanthes scabra]
MYDPVIPINMTLVREFYANRDQKNQCEVYMRGRKIPCHLGDIERILHIPRLEGASEHKAVGAKYDNNELDMDEVMQVIGRDGATWPEVPDRISSKILNKDAWMWMKLVVCNILPTRHETTLGADHILLIYALKGMTVSLLEVMVATMNEDPTKYKRQLLPFPMFITKWAKEAGIPTYSGDEIFDEFRTGCGNGHGAIVIDGGFNRCCNSMFVSISLSFDFEVYHGGWSGYVDGSMRYVGGQIVIVEENDSNFWCVFEADEQLTRFGYAKADIAAMWYKDPQVAEYDIGLMMFDSDRDALEMVRIDEERDYVELFVVHEGDQQGFPEVGYIDVGGDPPAGSDDDSGDGAARNIDDATSGENIGPNAEGAAVGGKNIGPNAKGAVNPEPAVNQNGAMCW